MIEKTLRHVVFRLFLILVCISMTKSLNHAKQVASKNKDVSKSLCLFIKHLYLPLNIIFGCDFL